LTKPMEEIPQLKTLVFIISTNKEVILVRLVLWEML
jgi:hypothetical protein